MNKLITDFDSTWNQLYQEAIIPLIHFLEGYDTTNNKLFENNIYIKIYTICYTICTQKSPYNFSNNLYEKYNEVIIDYLTNYVLHRLNKIHGELLLKEFIYVYNNHKIMVRWLRNFMMYLERFYVKYHKLDTLEDIGDNLFKSIVFENYKNSITSVIIHSINQYRYNGIINNELIINVIHIYEYMELYEYYFTKDFLASSREYYYSVSLQWLNEYTVQEYLVKTEYLIKKEKELVHKYLNRITEEHLINILYNELLINNLNKLLLNDSYGMKYMLVNEMLEDLNRLYKLTKKYTEQLHFIAKLFKDYMYNNIEFHSNIDELISINNKYDKYILEAFEDNIIFKIVKKDVFISIFNNVTNIELMITYIDKILKSESNDIDLVMKLFTYIVDKDIFVDYYRKYLCKRLLSQKTLNIDIEKLIISKIKIECGLQLTSKIEGMINDLLLSDEQNKHFIEYTLKISKQNSEKDFYENSQYDNSEKEFYDNSEKDFYDNCLNIQILTNSHWPNFKLFDIIIPNIMKNIMMKFNNYYRNMYTHKKITWIFTQGTIVLKSIFNKKSYDIQVSTLQGIILLLFNSSAKLDNNILDFNTIKTLTNIPDEILKRVLHSLSCGKFKVLTKIEKDSEIKNDKNIKNTDIFKYNDNFNNSLRKFKIPMPSIEDINDNKLKIEEDRSYTIDATIVRIMKTRKSLNHNNLISEVLSQLVNFNSEPRFIKKRIESLIEREYLERNSENRDFYNYLA